MKQNFNIFDKAFIESGDIENVFQIARENNVAVSNILPGTLCEKVSKIDNAPATGYVSHTPTLQVVSSIILLQSLNSNFSLTTINGNNILVLLKMK